MIFCILWGLLFSGRGVDLFKCVYNTLFQYLRWRWILLPKMQSMAIFTVSAGTLLRDTGIYFFGFSFRSRQLIKSWIVIKFIYANTLTLLGKLILNELVPAMFICCIVRNQHLIFLKAGAGALKGLMYDWFRFYWLSILIDSCNYTSPAWLRLISLSIHYRIILNNRIMSSGSYKWIRLTWD